MLEDNNMFYRVNLDRTRSSVINETLEFQR